MHRVARAVSGISTKRSVIAALLTLFFLEVVLTNAAFSASSEIDLLKQSWEDINTSESESSTIRDSESFVLDGLAGNAIEGAVDPVSTVNSIVVSSATELAAALKVVALSGGEIVLNPGEYGSLSLRNFNPASEVVFRSADPENPAHIGDITLRASSNLSFEGLEIGRALRPDEPLFTRLINAYEVTNVTFSNNEVHGSEDGNYNNDGFAFSFRDSSGIVLDNNEIHNLYRGAVFQSVSDITVTNNYIHNMRAEGLNFVGVEQVLIEGNYMTEFYPNLEAGDHADFIQFWTTGVGNSSDVVIRSNALIEGIGGTVQGIFVENDIPEYEYANFSIEGNLYYGSSGHGILVDDMQGGAIVNNTIIGTEGSPYVTNIGLDGTTNDVVVANNVATSFRYPDLASIFDNNVVAHYDDLQSATHVDNLFVNAGDTGVVTVADLVPRADGVLTQNGVGALVDSVVDIAILTGQQHGKSDSLTVELTAMDYDFVEGDGVVYRWTFSDGSVVSGPVVRHTFSGGGDQSVILEALNGNGNVLRSTEKALQLIDPVLLKLDFENGLDDGSSADRTATWNGTESYVTGATGAAASFSDDNRSSIVIPGSANLRGMTELTVQLDIQLGDHEYANSQDAQRVLYLAGNYGIEVTNEQTLNFFLWQEDGSLKKLTAKTESLADGDFHQITMSYSSEAGMLVAYVDGQEVGRAEGLSGKVGSNVGSDLVIGSGPFRDAFDGAIDNVKISQSFIDPDATKHAPSFQERFDGTQNGMLEIDDGSDFLTFENAELFGSNSNDDELSVFFDFRTAGQTGGQQRLLWNHLEYGVVLDDGDLIFWMFDGGNNSIKAVVRDAGVDDGAWHQVGFSLDEETGNFKGYIDGRAVVELEETDAQITEQGAWDVFVGGTPWGRTFMGEIDNLTAYSQIIDPLTEDVESNANLGSFDTDLLVA